MTLESQIPSPIRQHHILNTARAGGSVRIKDLALEFGVHEMTIRRDLDLLVEQGLLERVHGGARITAQTKGELEYSRRIAQHPDGKARIARAALSLIEDGDSVGLDASTTDLALARVLHQRAISAVVTGLDAAGVLAANEVPFILAGGHFHPPARSFTGGLFSSLLGKLKLDKVLFSCGAVSLERGFTDHFLPEVESKTALLASGRQLIALVDHSKFGLEAFCQIAPLEGIHTLITDADPPLEWRERLEFEGIRLVVAGR